MERIFGENSCLTGDKNLLLSEISDRQPLIACREWAAI